MRVHDFARYAFDLALTVLWIWVPMYQLNLKDARFAPAIWVVDVLTLAIVIYLLHRKAADHKMQF